MSIKSSSVTSNSAFSSNLSQRRLPSHLPKIKSHLTPHKMTSPSTPSSTSTKSSRDSEDDYLRIFSFENFSPQQSPFQSPRRQHATDSPSPLHDAPLAPAGPPFSSKFSSSVENFQKVKHSNKAVTE
jgi:hypothetical protein